MVIPIVHALITVYLIWAVVETKKYHEQNLEKWEKTWEEVWEKLCEDYPSLRDYDEDFADPPERFAVSIITGLLFLFWLFLCFLKIAFHQTPRKLWNAIKITFRPKKH
jgi:hypothetical protein